MDHGEIALFALNASRDFGIHIARTLDIPLSDHEERDFEDGEHKARPLISVRDRDVFVVQSLHSDPAQSVNDKLCRLLFFIGALRDASAARITAVVPYLGYARKDRKTKPRDPVTTRYVAALFEAVGVDRLLTMDVHNPAAYQNAFRCATDLLEARTLFAGWLVPRIGDDDLVVVSPDAGGMKRANRLRDLLSRRLNREVPAAFMEKYRSAGTVSGSAVVGAVKDRTAIILDDLVSSGTTLARAATACRDGGARRVYGAVTHGLFVGNANTVLMDEALEQILITDTVPPFRLERPMLESKVTVLPAAPFFAKAIERIHGGGSIVEINEPE